jgi:hypothetical protein
MDEDNKPVENEEEIEQQEQEESTGEKPDTQPKPNQEEEDGEEQEISNDPVEEEGEQEEEKPVSRRESKRIQALLDKFAQSDEARFGNRNQPAPRKPDGTQIIPEGEYDIEQINEMAKEYGQTLFKEGLSQATV